MQIADVKKALGSVRRMCKAGSRGMSLVRPNALGTLHDMNDSEGSEPAHQERAYRNAWEPFDPDGEGQEREGRESEEGLGEEGRENEEEEEGPHSKSLKVPMGPSQKEVEEHSRHTGR